MSGFASSTNSLSFLNSMKENVALDGWIYWRLFQVQFTLDIGFSVYLVNTKDIIKRCSPGSKQRLVPKG
ncbi:hypothetical protein HZH68_003131 [Vespula germanica]|uniref:Uncharacterized protein n=1 Tax=Vespula germanica TaxID=30212 RepID=A0A834U2M2_VESGE|nr:hypothetical protein HZH68_003131 [Vespula germanica]